MEYRDDGTLDREALVKGKLSMIDVKVSNGGFLEMPLQMAADLQARVKENGRSTTSLLTSWENTYREDEFTTRATVRPLQAVHLTFEG